MENSFFLSLVVMIFILTRSAYASKCLCLRDSEMQDYANLCGTTCDWSCCYDDPNVCNPDSSGLCLAATSYNTGQVCTGYQNDCVLGYINAFNPPNNRVLINITSVDGHLLGKRSLPKSFYIIQRAFFKDDYAVAKFTEPQREMMDKGLGNRIFSGIKEKFGEAIEERIKEAVIECTTLTQVRILCKNPLPEYATSYYKNNFAESKSFPGYDFAVLQYQFKAFKTYKLYIPSAVEFSCWAYDTIRNTDYCSSFAGVKRCFTGQENEFVSSYIYCPTGVCDAVTVERVECCNNADCKSNTYCDSGKCTSLTTPTPSPFQVSSTVSKLKANIIFLFIVLVMVKA